MMENYYAIIMAGGGGTRLWPLSRQAKPKQMLKIGNDTTLFQDSVNRLSDLFSSDKILVVTIAEQVNALQSQCPLIPKDNYLIEPFPRGTASVVGLASAFLRKKDPSAVMAVLTADHIINNQNKFHDLLVTAYRAARQGYLVTLGIQPTYPSTGYGYIHRGEKIIIDREQLIYTVKQFTEKPDLNHATELVNSGNYYWNSGMFIWSVEQIWGEFNRLMPDLFNCLEKIQQAIDTDQQNAVIESLWSKIHPQTIDYGIMEKAKQVVVLPGEDLGWNDVGSWDSIFDVLQADDDGNIIVDSDVISIDSHESLILSEDDSRLIATIGIKDLIVVDTHDVLLICNRKDAQRVREIVNKLRQKQKNQFL